MNILLHKKGVLLYLLGSGKEGDLLLNHKPTNPILGEIHKTRILHPDGTYSYIICEQTVHHPPTSAFDIYNPTHGVRLSGNMNFGVVFHQNSVTVETKGGLKVYLELKDGTKETYLMEAGVPSMFIKNVLLGTKYVYWTGNHCINSSNGWRAQMVFGFKDGKNTINGVIWNENESKGKKKEAKEEKEEKSGGWASRWTRSAVNAAKSTAKFTTGWLYDSEGEDGWITTSKIEFNPEDIDSRFYGVGGGETWIHPGPFKNKEEKAKKDAPPEDRYLLLNAKDLYSNECNEYPSILEENSSITVWRGVGEAIVSGDMETADIKKTEVEEKQRLLRTTRKENGEEFVPAYFHLDDSDGWSFWTINDGHWYREDQSQIYRAV